MEKRRGGERKGGWEGGRKEEERERWGGGRKERERVSSPAFSSRSLFFTQFTTDVGVRRLGGNRLFVGSLLRLMEAYLYTGLKNKTLYTHAHTHTQIQAHIFWMPVAKS